MRCHETLMFLDILYRNNNNVVLISWLILLKQSYLIVNFNKNGRVVILPPPTYISQVPWDSFINIVNHVTVPGWLVMIWPVVLRNWEAGYLTFGKLLFSILESTNATLLIWVGMEWQSVYLDGAK